MNNNIDIVNKGLHCCCTTKPEEGFELPACYPIKQLTYKGEQFYPLTALSSVISCSGESLDTILSKIWDRLTPQILDIELEQGDVDDVQTWEFTFKDDEALSEDWMTSLRNGVRFTVYGGIKYDANTNDAEHIEKTYVIYPYSVEEVNGVTYWRYNFYGRDIVIDSNSTINYIDKDVVITWNDNYND